MTDVGGWPRSVSLFESATWSGTRAADSFAPPGDAYPGTRPDGSYVVDAGTVRGVDPSGDGWVERDSGASVDLAGRHLVLAYGANGDPARLAYEVPTGLIPVLRCLVVGWAAVWTNARRRFDGAVLATIAPDPGRVELHHVVAVTDAQLVQMDAWEGHPTIYERQRLSSPLLLENGQAPTGVWWYVGTSTQRPPLLVDGRPLRVADHDQRAVDPLVARRTSPARDGAGS